MAEQPFDRQKFKSDQKQDWDLAAAGWKKWWPLFEQSAQHVSDRLLDLARVKSGDRVLDIATGTGEPAITAARRVGAKGRVVATDQSSGMLAIGRERAVSGALANVEFIESDAETLAVTERDFDAVVCRWGLMFMPDLGAALANIRTRMKRGAYFATAVWSTPDKVPMITLAADTVRKIANLPPPPAGTLDPLRLADTTILERELKTAGFKNVAIERRQVIWEMQSPEEFTQFRRDIAAPFRTLLERQTPEMRDRILAAVTDAARGIASPDGKVRTSNETILFCAEN